MENNKSNIATGLDLVLQKLANQEEVNLKSIIGLIGEVGFSLMFIIFALPSILPIPGISAIFGAVMMVLSIELLFKQKTVLVPNFIANKTIKFSTLYNIVHKILSYEAKISRFLKPRLDFTHHQFVEKFLAVMLLILSTIITLPIVLGNAVPAFSIILISLGTLYKDGIATLLGIITGIMGIIVAYMVVKFGYLEALRYVMGLLQI